MQGWLQFYAVAGGASATLLGLLFVAVSINAPASLGDGQESSRRMAEQAFQNYITVILVSLLALYPDISIPTYGRVVVTLSALSAGWAMVRLYLSLAKPTGEESRLAQFRRQATSLIGFAMLLYAAVRMAMGDNDIHDLFAASTMVLVAAAAVVSWELLLRMAKTERPGGASSR
jgi:hypothetical protein